MQNEFPKEVFVGVDPGASGAMVAIDCEGKVCSIAKNSETERDLWDWLSCKCCLHAMIESVHSMPKQGVSSSFKFGRNYGFLRGILIASETPFDEVTPQKWQAAMRCRTKGDKNVSKARAQQLFPSVKVTHAIADALLIAEYCRQTKLPFLPAPEQPQRVGESTSIDPAG